MDQTSGRLLQTFVQEIPGGARCHEDMIPGKKAPSELGSTWTESGPSTQ